MVQSHFDDALFSSQSPITDEHYNERARDNIFEQRRENSYVEVLILDHLYLARLAEASECKFEDDFVAVSKVGDEPQNHSNQGYGYIHQNIPTRLWKEKIRDKKWLGEVANETKYKFRVFILRQRHSYSRVQTTQDLFDRLLHECEVFPKFKDYMVGFGVKYQEQGIGPRPLVHRPLLYGCKGNGGNRAYQGFECAYTLRYAERTCRVGKQPWSIRQMTVYHRYQQHEGPMTSTWILVGATSRAEKLVDDYCQHLDTSINEVNPFEIHIMILDMAVASWGPYLIDMSQSVKHQSDKALVASLDQNDEINLIAMEDQQALSQIESQLIDVIMCSDSTADTNAELAALYEQHQRLKSTASECKLEEKAVIDTPKLALRQKSKEIMHTRKMAEALVSKTKTSRDLISSFLDLQNALSLRQIQIESAKESTAMRNIAEKNQQDSTSLKVLSIITMIYLPFSIVTSFYSSQFVYQVELDGRMIFAYSSLWWLIIAISIPLMLVTMGIWHYWSTRGLHEQRITREIYLNIRNVYFKSIRALRQRPHEEGGLPMS